MHFCLNRVRASARCFDPLVNLSVEVCNFTPGTESQTRKYGQDHGIIIITVVQLISSSKGGVPNLHTSPIQIIIDNKYIHFFVSDRNRGPADCSV